MTRIRMVTEAVKQVAQGLNLGVNELEDLPSDLKNLSENLSSAWQEGNAEHYAGEIARLAGDLQGEIENLQYLSSRLNYEASEWENADSFGALRWSNLAVIPITLATSAALPTVIQTKSFNWLGWIDGTHIVDHSLDFLGNIPNDSTLSEFSYKGMGRALNALADNQKAGFVGFMNDVGHVIKNPVISDGLPLGLGIVSDLGDGDSVSKAFFSEGAEFLIDKGLYAIPVVGQVYLGYQIGLGVGHLISGGMEIVGMHEQALAMQNTLEVMDISERLGDAVADFVLDPPQLPLDEGIVGQAQAQFNI